MHKTLYFQQKAMATLFEGWLCGEDVSHLRSVAQLLQEEILRIELLLSRYDARAELARINREGAKGKVKVERELFEVLADCLSWQQKTAGYFDIGVQTKSPNYPGLAKSLSLFPESSQVVFRLATLSLDLGGYGKGYALDMLETLLTLYGVENFLLHGGKSSFLARGKQGNGNAWQVQYLDEGEYDQARSFVGGLSYSGTFNEKEKISDIIEIDTGQQLKQALACVVQANTALEAEVWSTALLSMGPDKGKAFAEKPPTDFQVKFIEQVIL